MTLKILDRLSSRLLTVAPRPETSQAAHSFDTGAVTDTIQRALASAGLDPHAGSMKGVSDTIRQALSSAGLRHEATAGNGGATRQARVWPGRIHGVAIDPAVREGPTTSGEFLGGSFSNAAGKRDYRLYVPASYSSDAMAAPVPMLVMLHGCTQSPEDFAAGTRMNALAERHGFLVLYPAQAANANGSKCWNWFRPEDQQRDRGEPLLIAGITREVAANYRIDKRRIFVAGLSAGAAMAVILGATYPELYAAVGAHSGLPHAAAHDMPSAFAAMKGGARAGTSRTAGVGFAPASGRTVPTIVFHGDRDRTVDIRNGEAIVEQATRGRTDRSPLRATVHEGAASDGASYRRTVYVDATDQPVVEQWVLHGAGHAWSGGSPNGSFTAAQGPDASTEMIRFFYSRPG